MTGPMRATTVGVRPVTSVPLMGCPMERSSNPDKFLLPDESAAVEEAVEQAEKHTSAEIKVVVTRHCWDDIRYKAAAVFRELKLDRAEQRNCVLILLVTTNHEFLIYGDEGIHGKVGLDFWDDVRERMQKRFAEGAFGEGLCEGVRLVGEKLAEHFPYQAGDTNEIPDDVAHTE